MIRSISFFMAFAVAIVLALAGQATAQDGYKLRPGDTLRFEVLEDPTLNRSVLIAPDGRISVPLIGAIQASGRTVDTLQADLTAKLGPNFASAPSVYVALERQKEAAPSAGGAAAAAPGIEIFVLGEAGKPGRLEVEPGTTVLQLFAQIGGFTKFAAIKRIQLRRGDQTWLLNYKAIEAGSSTAGSTILAEGDVIVVPQRKLFE